MASDRELESRPRIAVLNLNPSASERAGVRQIGRALVRLGARSVERHFARLDAAGLNDRFDGVVLGPQGVPFDAYRQGERERLFELIRALQVPALGICGGCQALALAHGGMIAPWGGGLASGTYDGLEKATGLRGVQCDPDPLFAEVGAAGRFAVSHVEAISRVPAGLEVVARSDYCPVQAIRVSGRPIWGVQFHPERGGDGESVLRAFITQVLVYFRPS